MTWQRTAARRGEATALSWVDNNQLGASPGTAGRPQPRGDRSPRPSRVLLIPAEAQLTDAVAQRLSGDGHDVSLSSFGDAVSAVRDYDAVCNLQPAEEPPRGWLGSQLRWHRRNRQRQALRMLDGALAGAPAIRLVQRSTADLYSDGGGEWVRETHPTEPTGLTEAAREGELLAEEHRRRGGAAAILRLAHLYGPDYPGTIEAVRLARRGWQAFHGPDDAYYPFLHVADAASAIALAVTAPPGTYNVGDAFPATNGQLNHALARLVGRDQLYPLWPAHQYSDQGLSLRSCRLDPARFFLATGWKLAQEWQFLEAASQAYHGV